MSQEDMSQRSASDLWASLHERVAGTAGVHELDELQRRFDAAASECCVICCEALEPSDHKTSEYGEGYAHDDCIDSYLWDITAARLAAQKDEGVR